MGISVIVAMTKDRVIGSEGDLPWHITEDMKLFKSLTEQNTVIMGKTTWLSIPEQFRPLPGRANIIVSTTLEDQAGAKVCKSVDEAVRVVRKNNNEIFCMGGAKLYAAMLPLADTLCISWVKDDYDGDTYFPEIDFSRWKEVETKEFSEFTFRRYLKQ
jgi:dihydrofolate reductase